MDARPSVTNAPRPVAVPLSDYEVKFTTADGVTKTGSRKTGEAFWVPGSTRVVEVGDKPAESVIVELKSPASSSASK